MLKRAPPSGDRNAERQRRYRERLKQHQIAVVVPVNEAVINFLVRMGWLVERDSHKRKLIDESISRMIAEAEQHPPRYP
jgi:hypothetical protein